MNFKFTRLKTIISIIAGLLLGYSFKYMCINDSVKVCSGVLLKNILFHLIGFIIGFSIIFIICSLLEIKKKKMRK
jgi:hypothetical protein